MLNSMNMNLIQFVVPQDSDWFANALAIFLIIGLVVSYAPQVM